MQLKSTVISLFTPHDAGRIQFRIHPVKYLANVNAGNTRNCSCNGTSDKLPPSQSEVHSLSARNFVPYLTASKVHAYVVSSGTSQVFRSFAPLATEISPCSGVSVLGITSAVELWYCARYCLSRRLRSSASDLT